MNEFGQRFRFATNQLALILLGAVVLGGCGEEPPAPKAKVRLVKATQIKRNGNNYLMERTLKVGTLRFGGVNLM